MTQVMIGIYKVRDKSSEFVLLKEYDLWKMNQLVCQTFHHRAILSTLLQTQSKAKMYYYIM